MNKMVLEKQKENGRFTSRIEVEDWEVTPVSIIAIQQQPAHIIPIPLPYAPWRARYSHVWQVRNEFASLNSNIHYNQEEYLC